MKHLFGSGVLAAGIISLAVACGGTTPATSGPGIPSSLTPTLVAPSVGAPTLAPNVPPVDANHGDPALEALLPASVSGTSLTRSSLTLTQLLEGGGDRTELDAFLLTLNKTEADGSYASAYDPTNVLDGGINAFKIAGADAAALLAGIVSLESSDLGEEVTTTQATVGGKNVTVLSAGDGVNDTEWVYGYGDVVFAVHAADEAHAAAFLAALP